MKRLLLHVFLGFILLFSFVYLSLQSISEMTMHGESILVPDLRSFSISEVEDTLKTLKLRFSVVDSGAYNADYPRGSVIDHLPKYNSRVKEDREVYLTVNPKNISLISLPNYTDRSSRQYISELKAKGFRIGKFIYKKDEHANVVLGVRYQGEVVRINDMLEKATILDLVLGNGKGVQIEMPNLMRISKKHISSRLQNLALNKGDFYYDASVVDTMSAFVYKQSPVEGTENVDLGVFVNLWFTEDSSKFVEDMLELMRQDSLKARLDSILND